MVLDGTEQLDLFATPRSWSVPDCPIDPICGKPVRWMPRRREWGMYCGGQKCISPIRICKNPDCRKEFKRYEGGTLFCSPECRERWHFRKPSRDRRTGICSKCGQPRHTLNRWELCSECYEPIHCVNGRLAKHHVPIPVVHRLLEDPTCQNPGCDVNLLEPRYSHGKVCYELVVDHNHRCGCGGEYSCGICVRGLLCTLCNTAYGQLREDELRIQGLLEYHRSVMVSTVG